MNKVANSAEKNCQSKPPTKSLSAIKFNLSQDNLLCFKEKFSEKPRLIPKTECLKDNKWMSQHKVEITSNNSMQNAVLERSRAISSNSSFIEKVVIMQYDNLDVYIDNSTRKKSNSNSSQESKPFEKKEEEDEGSQDDFLESCVRVVTEETDYTENRITYSYQTTPQSLTPRSSRMEESQFYPYEYYYEGQTNVSVGRNKRSVTNEESKAYIIDFNKIELDGRTTIMIKNIPNKYTQETLLEEFQDKLLNKFDFFYLPVDKDNDCNVGYAFVNFINCSDIKNFYQDFHLQKWKRYDKSPKICNICYARCQGTLQLADHFKHTKIINQKDKKGKPLIGITEASKIKMEEIIKSQRNHQSK